MSVQPLTLTRSANVENGALIIRSIKIDTGGLDAKANGVVEFGLGEIVANRSGILSMKKLSIIVEPGENLAYTPKALSMQGRDLVTLDVYRSYAQTQREFRNGKNPAPGSVGYPEFLYQKEGVTPIYCNESEALDFLSEYLTPVAQEAAGAPFLWCHNAAFVADFLSAATARRYGRDRVPVGLSPGILVCTMEFFKLANCLGKVLNRRFNLPAALGAFDVSREYGNGADDALAAGVLAGCLLDRLGFYHFPLSGGPIKVENSIPLSTARRIVLPSEITRLRTCAENLTKKAGSMLDLDAFSQEIAKFDLSVRWDMSGKNKGVAWIGRTGTDAGAVGAGAIDDPFLGE
jgi:hypothetical protein